MAVPSISLLVLPFFFKLGTQLGILLSKNQLLLTIERKIITILEF